MNRLLTTILSGAILLTAGWSTTSAAEPEAGLPWKKEYQERQRRVDQLYAPARFGLFYTWGMASGSLGSWEGYEHPLPYNTVEAFEAAAKDPEAVAANMVAAVKQAGARYLIFTVFDSCNRYFVTYPSKVPGYRWKIGMEKSILDGIKSGQYHLSGVTMPMIYETSEYLQNRGLPTAPSHTIDESLARETDDSESKKFRKFGLMMSDAYVPWDIIDALRPGNPYSNQ